MTAQADHAQVPDDVLAGLTAIRETAEAFMDKRDLAGDGWTEPEVTSVSVTEGRPHVEVVMFNQNQEGRGRNRLGADYLWWWLDSGSDECFGMLVQAKRLKLVAGGWHVDIAHRDGDQLRSLLRTSSELQVPAIYSIYTGGLIYRASMPCLHTKTAQEMVVAAPAPVATTPATGLPAGEDCARCRRMAISMVTAYQLTSVWESPAMTGSTALTESVPLEDLADPATPNGVVWDLNLSALTDPELVDFLRRPQLGARLIAKRIFRLVAARRSMQFSAATAAPVTIDGAPVFSDVPLDPGHFPGPYYEHVLQGLRSSAPGYLEQLLGPEMPWDSTSEYLPGRMVVSPPSPGRRRPDELLNHTNIAGVVILTL